MPDDLRLVPLGIGDAFTALHYTSGLAVGFGTDWLLVDCPHPIRKMLREASLACGETIDVDRTVGVALTHLHADHSSGLEDFAYYNHFYLGRRTRLAIHPEVSARLWDGHLVASMGSIKAGPTPDAPPVRKTLDDYFELVPLDTAAPTALGPFTLECRRTVHGIPTYALKIQAGGKTLGVSSDTGYDPALIDWLAPADLIVHEATAQPESAMHTPYTRLAALPEPLRAKIRLTHLPDGFVPPDAALELLAQGTCYRL